MVIIVKLSQPTVDGRTEVQFDMTSASDRSRYALYLDALWMNVTDIVITIPNP